MKRLIVGAAILISLLGSRAWAEPVPSYIEDSVGEWLIATDDGKPGCNVSLSADRVGDHFKIAPSAECASRLPTVSGAASWDYDSGVRLFDADGSLLLEFAEDESTMMKTSFETPPVHFMVPAKSGVDHAPFAPALVGNWVLQRPGGAPLCPLLLGKDAQSEDTELTVKTGSPCDGAVSRLKLDSARVEDFTLMLYGQPETSLSFEPSGSESFIKTEAGKPLEMVRTH
jgi:hypothetical protein